MTLALVLALLVAQDAGTVAGRVQTTDGKSASGIRVAAIAVSTSNPAASVSAENDGRYRFVNLASGRYYIVASPDLPTYYPGTASETGATIVTVTAGASIRGLDFRLARFPGVKVTGRVKDMPSELPEDVLRMMLTSTNSSNRAFQRQAIVRTDGHFEFAGVSPDTYNFQPSIGGSQTRVEVKYGDVGPIEISLGRVLVGRVTVDDGSRLPPDTLTATAFPQAFAFMNPSLVQVLDRRSGVQGNSVFAVARTDGFFLVPSSYQADDYRLGVRLPFGYWLKSMSYRGEDLMRSPLRIGRAAPDSGIIEIALSSTPPEGTPPGVRVKGRVAASVGSMLQAQRVILETTLPPIQFPVNLRLGEARVESDGTFEFRDVPPGTYKASVISLGDPPAVAVTVEDWDVQGIEVPDAPLRQPAGVVVAVSAVPVGIRVSGRVHVAPDSVSKPRAVVLFGPRDGLSVEVPIAPDGSFEASNVLPGAYDVRTVPLSLGVAGTKIVVANQDIANVQVGN